MSSPKRYGIGFVVVVSLFALCGCPQPAPTAAFTATPLSGTAPLAVQFTDGSDGNGSTIATWSWNFGDQATSTLQNPTHTYAQVGTYTVALTVTTSAGSDTETKTNYITVSAPQSVTFFVSPEGNDSNAGTEQAPWLTIQHAVDTVVAGDVINIAEGTYTEDVTISDSGAVANRTVLVGSTTGTTTLTGSITLAPGVARVDISNLAISGFMGNGVTLSGDNQFIALRELTITGGDAGIRMTLGNSGGTATSGGVSDIEITDCLIQNPGSGGILGVPGPCDRVTISGAQISGAGLGSMTPTASSGVRIEKGNSIDVVESFIHDNAGTGIDLGSGVVTGGATGINLRRNILNGNQMNGIVLHAGGQIENNVLVNQGRAAVVVGEFPGTFQVINNTIAYNMFDEAFAMSDYNFIAGAGMSGGTGVNLSLVNNIFAFNVGPTLGAPRGIFLGANINLVRESNNLFWSEEAAEITAEFVARDEKAFTRVEILDGTWATQSGQGTGEVGEDPLFVGNWPDVDPHLLPGSPAADAGASVGAPDVDVEGTTRPQGAGYSIGAYEE